MPLTPVDYSKTVIYKIQHNEDETLLYVGSTTDFTRRKSKHKSDCNNINGKSYNYKVYQMIRDNGGWEAFNMIEIEKYPCNDKREAEKRENEIMIELKANMNMRKSYCGYNTTQEYKQQYQQEYRIDNKETIQKNKKKYYNDNKETIKQYNIDNKNKIQDYQQQYRIDNKETIITKKKEKITCECGCQLRRCDMSRHCKTNKHIQLMNKTIE